MPEDWATLRGNSFGAALHAAHTQLFADPESVSSIAGEGLAGTVQSTEVSTRHCTPLPPPLSLRDGGRIRRGIWCLACQRLLCVVRARVRRGGVASCWLPLLTCAEGCRHCIFLHTHLTRQRALLPSMRTDGAPRSLRQRLVVRAWRPSGTAAWLLLLLPLPLLLLSLLTLIPGAVLLLVLLLALLLVRLLVVLMLLVAPLPPPQLRL